MKKLAMVIEKLLFLSHRLIVLWQIFHHYKMWYTQ